MQVATTVENIRALPAKFLALPAQAVSARLVGLEGFAESNAAAAEVQREVERKALVAQVQSREANNIALVLHDTSKEEASAHLGRVVFNRQNFKSRLPVEELTVDTSETLTVFTAVLLDLQF